MRETSTFMVNMVHDIIFIITDLPKILQIVFDHRLCYLATKTLQFFASSLCNPCFKIAT